MIESTLVRNILRALNAVPTCKAIKLHGSPYLERGTPDVLCVYDGRVYWLEIKLPGEQPTAIQRHRLAEWTEAGATCRVVRTVGEAMRVMDE